VLTGSSLRSRWTLVVAVAASAVLLTGTVLFLRRGGSPSPAAAHASPSELPSADPSPVPTGAISVLPASSPAPQTTPPRPRPRPATAPASTAPATPDRKPPATLGPNLSLGAGSDGSTKAGGTRFRDVRDGNRATFWSPEGPTGEISIKSDTPVTLSRVIIRGAAGGGAIQAWRLSDHDTGDALASGTGAGSIAFAPRRLRKITFEILRADGTPRVAEFETYGG
jgi:hypothetical protein